MWMRWLAVVCFFAGPVAADAKKPPQSLKQLSGSFEGLTRTVGPAVVQISASGYAPRDAGGNRFVISKHRATGSGVIVDANGYIITNAHVVRGANTLKVQLPPEYATGARAQSSIVKAMNRPHPAKLIGLDSETDIALLKIEVKGLVAATIGDSDAVQPGQLVLAFGSPLGLSGSVSFGIVSSVGRQVRPDHPMVYIQTDAPINPGNSGGPLINADGEIIGINTFILSQSGGSEGLGFSVPSNIMKSVYQQLRKRGRVIRGSVGLHAQTVTPVLAAGLGLPRNWGVLVADVYPDGPAEKAGLKAGDLILTLNGKRMENGRQFEVNVYQEAVGTTLRVQVLREKSVLTRSVKVEARPDRLENLADSVDPRDHLIAEIGILAMPVDGRIARALGKLREPGGVIVVGTAATSVLAGDEAFVPGDIIRAVNTMTVESVADLRQAARTLVQGESAVIRVERRGQFLYLPFEIE
ncbi:MAG: trypsin-like peptidase domain-containing protein [Myxococcota bacterium]